MAKRHEEMAREFWTRFWYDAEHPDAPDSECMTDPEAELAALLARVEREAIERAAAEVYNTLAGRLGIKTQDELAARIRALLEDGDA